MSASKAVSADVSCRSELNEVSLRNDFGIDADDVTLDELGEPRSGTGAGRGPDGTRLKVRGVRGGDTSDIVVDVN